MIEIPDDAYQELMRSASEKGSQPEQIASEILAGRLIDPVMKLAGCLSMPISDIAERHDDYIGAGLLLTHNDES